MNFKKITRITLLLGSMALATSVFAKGPAPVYSANITEAEVLAAQKAWGDALVQISDDFASGGFAKAKATANAVLDAVYGYNMGPVLFKPTLTVAPQTFRVTKEGALAYFVGGDSKFPKDTGFALSGWKKVDIVNTAIHINGDKASTMGNVTLTDKNGKKPRLTKPGLSKKMAWAKFASSYIIHPCHFLAPEKLSGLPGCVRSQKLLQLGLTHD